MSNGFDDLATLIAYLDANREKIARLRQEVDEIHAGFSSEFAESREAWESDLAAAVGLARQRYGETDPALREAVEQRLPDVRQRKAQRLQEARDRLVQLEAERDSIEQDSVETTEALKATNPKLDAREEHLKQRLAQERAKLAEIDAQTAEAAAGLGWLLYCSRIFRLRGERKEQAVAVGTTSVRLNEVRRQWREMEQTATEAEERRQEAWRLRTTEIAKTAREIEELEDDFDGVCLRAALEEHFREADAAIRAGVEELDALLARGLQQRDEQREYENGIVAVSETLGLMGGVAEGMQRLGESVQGVKDEQDMHAELSHLRLEAPAYVLEFDRLWDALWPSVENEKSAIAHPARLAEILRDITGTRLTDERIQAYFETLGDTLTRATEAWH